MPKPKNAPSKNEGDSKPNDDAQKMQGSSDAGTSGTQQPEDGQSKQDGDTKSDADSGNPNAEPLPGTGSFEQSTAGFAMPVPGIGRIVHYCLTDDDAAAINRRREHRGGPVLGIAHVGNVAMEGDLLPMIIVATHGDHAGSAVNGQVFLDGNDTLWVTSVLVGEGPGRFAWPQRA